MTTEEKIKNYAPFNVKVVKIDVYVADEDSEEEFLEEKYEAVLRYVHFLPGAWKNGWEGRFLFGDEIPLRIPSAGYLVTPTELLEELKKHYELVEKISEADVTVLNLEDTLKRFEHKKNNTTDEKQLEDITFRIRATQEQLVDARKEVEFTKKRNQMMKEKCPGCANYSEEKKHCSFWIMFVVECVEKLAFKYYKAKENE